MKRDLITSFLGFDNLFEPFFNEGFNVNYPPCNIIKKGDSYSIEMSVAGFSKEDISIKLIDDNMLVVSGNIKDKKEKEEVEYVYRGLSKKGFKRSFALNDKNLEISKIELNNGILLININKIAFKDNSVKTFKID